MTHWPVRSTTGTFQWADRVRALATCATVPVPMEFSPVETVSTLAAWRGRPDADLLVVADRLDTDVCLCSEALRVSG